VCIDYKIPRYKSNWEFIDEVEKIDDYTVKYHFKEIRATFIHGTLLQFIKPKHIWEPIIKSAVAGKENLQDEIRSIVNLNPTETQTIGTGPYIIKEWNRTQFISMELNEDYHMKGRRIKGRTEIYRIGPKIDGIFFRIYRSTETALEELKKGNIDYIWWEILPEKLTKLEKNPDINLTKNVQNSVYYLSFNVRKSPFNYRRFRQAMSWLIDKNYIVEKILKGYGDAMISIVPEGNKLFYNENVMDYGTKSDIPRKEREKEARSLLRQAGFSWDSEGNLVNPDGNKLETFTILTPTADYDPIRALCGFIISEWWNSIGVPAVVRPVSFSEMLDYVFTKRDFDVYIMGWQLDVFPSYLRDLFHSSQDEPNGSNSSGYNDAEFDRISDEFVNETDIAKQIVYAKRLQEIIAIESVMIPLYSKSFVEAHSNRFTGWLGQLNGIGNFWSLVFIEPTR